jgi:uncharacterized membrane protein YgdD (TMEM256/DUF423 family)
MRIKSSLGLAVGPANAVRWGQVLVLPEAYGIIEIEDGLNEAQRHGIQALSLLGEKLSRGLISLNSLEALADSVKHANIISLVLLVPVGKIVYIVMRGEGCVYLKRGSELASLMAADGGMSGELREGDTLLLVSRGFSGLLSREELTHLFDHLRPSEIAEKLTLLLHAKKDGEGSVALVYSVDAFEDTARVPSIEENSENAGQGIKNEQVPPAVPSSPAQIAEKLNVQERIRRVHEYFRRLRQEPRKMTSLIAVALSIVFVLSVALGVWKQTTAKKNQQITTAMSDAQYALNEGVALLPLNPTKGKERLENAKELLSPFVPKGSPKTTQEYNLVQLYQKVTDNLTQAMQIVSTPLSLFYDVSLLKKSASATSISLDGDTLAIGDETTGTVYEMNITTKNAQIIGGGNSIKDVHSVAVYGNYVYVLTSDGIVQVGVSNAKSSLIIKKDDKWGVVTSLVSFGGNLYILDTQNSRIWKYIATDTSTGAPGFSDLHEYLNPDTLPDFSRATSLAIDGSVWLGTTDGKILRFTQGKENTYTPQGVDPPFGNNLYVYTHDDVNNVYVLDTQSNRVVVLDKDGTYLSQYRYQSSVHPERLIVSEADKKMLFLAGGKIYSLDIK